MRVLEFLGRTAVLEPAPDDETGSHTFPNALGDAMIQMLTIGAVCVGVLLLAGLILLLTRRRRT